MAYFGKVFKAEREEKIQEFLKSLNMPTEGALNFEPSIKIEKDGDNYIMTKTHPGGDRIKTFTSGKTFDDPTRNNTPATSTITVEGNTFTEVRDFGGKGSLTLKREFSDDKLVVTITSTMWPGGEARVFYSA